MPSFSEENAMDVPEGQPLRIDTQSYHTDFRHANSMPPQMPSEGGFRPAFTSTPKKQLARKRSLTPAPAAYEIKKSGILPGGCLLTLVVGWCCRETLVVRNGVLTTRWCADCQRRTWNAKYPPNPSFMR